MLEPERLKSWEAGLRKSIGRVLDVDAAYYENRIHNLVYRATALADDPTGASQNTSTPVKGGRAAPNWRFVSV